MTNFNNPKGNRNEANVPLTPNEESSYREGYDRGRVGNEQVQSERERAAENGGAANGLIIGATLAALLGLGGLAYYLSTKPADVIPAPTTIINQPTPAATVTPQPNKETKVIERTIEKTAPPQVKVIEKQVPGETKVIKVPGETKIIEVPKPVVVPTTAPATSTAPSTSSPAPNNNSNSSAGSSSKSTPAKEPAPAASTAPDTNSSPDASTAPTTPSSGTN